MSFSNSSIAVITSCSLGVLCVSCLLFIISQHFLQGFASTTPFIRYPILAFFIFSLLTITQMLIFQILLEMTKFYSDYPCAAMPIYVFYALARLSMYYFWLGRLYHVFKGSTWELSVSRTRKLAIIMVITSSLCAAIL